MKLLQSWPRVSDHTHGEAARIRRFQSFLGATQHEAEMEMTTDVKGGHLCHA